MIICLKNIKLMFLLLFIRISRIFIFLLYYLFRFLILFRPEGNYHLFIIILDCRENVSILLTIYKIFHQLFTCEFFIQKCFMQLFSSYILALWLFVEKISAQKAQVKWWWHWHLVYIANNNSNSQTLLS